MATHLDLEEQEQLDQLKDFWKQYGSLITWVLILGLGALAAWRGWEYWQADRAVKASALYEELDRAAQSAEVERVTTLFADMRQRYPKVTYTEQGALLAARAQFGAGKLDAAVATLSWLAESGASRDYRSIARLRLAGLLIDLKKYDDALKWLSTDIAPEFAGLAADRRADVLMLQGKRSEAIAAYQEAWRTLDATLDYRRVVQTKLEVLGVPPEVSKPAVVVEGS